MLAVADIDRKAARAAADRFDIPHALTDYRELLALDGIDAVSVSGWSMPRALPSGS